MVSRSRAVLLVVVGLGVVVRLDVLDSEVLCGHRKLGGLVIGDVGFGFLTLQRRRERTVSEPIAVQGKAGRWSEW